MRCKPAVLTLFLFLLAMVGLPAAAQAQWAQLGCRDVDFGVDRDVIRVGRRDGRFTHIRLRAGNNDIRVLDVKVVYANGQPDDIPVRAVIRARSTTAALGLSGAERVIDRVELLYAAVPNFRGRARICVEGREAERRQPAWVELGCTDVALSFDRDSVRVGRRDGRFAAIRLRAAGNSVQMLDLKVIYSNGERDDIPVRARIAQGGSSGALDLRGQARAIERVDLTYARVPNHRGRARICIDGKAM
jgi:hypothetical protein